MLNGPSQDLKDVKHAKGISLVLIFLLKRFSSTHSLVLLAYVCFTFVCILFKCHIYTLALFDVSCCVFMCLVIRFPSMFGNVRACTNLCLV